jgi:DNA-binding NarL/FixJ family response regulator
MTSPIRVAVVDRCPAVRAGVPVLLGAHPDLAPAGAARDQEALWPLLYRARPDVVLLEHDPGSGAGLATCLRINARPLGPRVVVWAAEPGTDIIVAATLAGADAIVDKTADVRELLHAVRAVGHGRRVLPRFTPVLQSAAAARLAAEDRPIFAMRLAGTPPSEIAPVVGLSRRALDARTAAIVTTLGTREGSPPRRDDTRDTAVIAIEDAA